jgi:hypothetical protein
MFDDISEEKLQEIYDEMLQYFNKCPNPDIRDWLIDTSDILVNQFDITVAMCFMAIIHSSLQEVQDVYIALDQGTKFLALLENLVFSNQDVYEYLNGLENDSLTNSPNTSFSTPPGLENYGENHKN